MNQLQIPDRLRHTDKSAIRTLEGARVEGGNNSAVDFLQKLIKEDGHIDLDVLRSMPTVTRSEVIDLINEILDQLDTMVDRQSVHPLRTKIFRTWVNVRGLTKMALLGLFLDDLEAEEFRTNAYMVMSNLFGNLRHARDYIANFPPPQPVSRHLPSFHTDGYEFVPVKSGPISTM